MIEILDENIPFSGKWEIQIDSVASGSQIIIKESGIIDHAILRFAMHYVFGMDSTVKGFFNALAVHFGEEIKK